MDEETKTRVDRKFYGHDKLKAKYTPKNPNSTEREYVRLVNQYMKLLKDELNETLPEFKKIYKAEMLDNDDYRQNYHADSMTGIMMAIEKLFQKISTNLQKKIDNYKLREKIQKLATQGRKLSIKEWKKAIKATLGIDLKEDYFNGKKFEALLDQWVNANVDLIKTIPHQTLGDMKEMVYGAFDAGMNTTDLAKAIQDIYGTSRQHARFIARDQCAKLNGEIQRQQQLDSGITHYIWSTSDDERVRSCHAELDGKVFSWNDPPEMWYDTKKGRVYTGRFCHPGQDFQCRCVGRPIFNREGLNIVTEDEVADERQY